MSEYGEKCLVLSTTKIYSIYCHRVVRKKQKMLSLLLFIFLSNEKSLIKIVAMLCEEYLRLNIFRY